MVQTEIRLNRSISKATACQAVLAARRGQFARRAVRARQQPLVGLGDADEGVLVLLAAAGNRVVAAAQAPVIPLDRLAAGAGYVYVLSGQMQTMPGLGSHLAAERMDLAEDGRIVGLF